MVIPEPVFTIAIPHYKQSEAHFSAALESALAQTERRIEIVVVDDLREDSYAPRVIARFGDPRIRYSVNSGPQGIGAAWNACIDAASADLVVILHADDALEPSYVQTMLDLARKRPDADIYFCRATIIDEAGKPIVSVPDAAKELIGPRSNISTLRGESSVAHLAVGNFIMCPTVTYRRSRIGGRRFSLTSRFVLDLEFTVGVLFDGGTIVGTRRQEYRYRRHDSSATTQFSRSGYRFHEEMRFHRELARRAAARGWRVAAFAANLMLLVRANVLYTALQDATRRRWRAAVEKLGLLSGRSL